jgi:hypothetical protein
MWSPDGRNLVWGREGRLWMTDTAGRSGHFLTGVRDRFHLEFPRGWLPDRSHLRYVAGSVMGEEFRLRIVGRDSTDDVPDSSKVPVVTRSQLGVLPDASLLYWGAGSALVFAEPGARGRPRRCFVQDGLTD